MKKIFAFIFVLVAMTAYGNEVVTVYGPESMKWIQRDIASKFKEETGVEIKFVSINGLVPRMKLEKNNPRADVVLGLTPSSAEMAKNEGLTAKYRPKSYKNISKEEFIMDEEWYVTPFDYGALAINYDAQMLKNPPKSFEEISKMEKQFLVEDPRSFTGQEFMLWTIAVYGDQWKEFWKNLKPSILTVTPSWDEAFAKFTAKEAPMMAGYASSSVYFYQDGNQNKYKSFIPEEGGYVYLEGAALVSKKKIKKGSKKFMDYILEKDFQELTAKKNYMFPVTNVKLPEEYKYVPVPKKVVTISGKDAVANLETWKKELIDILKD
ncbi:thiamine ABC transporter substrate-binding protein [Ilyobacter polytropus]|uniref:ABC transporter, periplasmic binding protein, thiB subfamily n=1 Tax=Ilyobacter polytropus (strain ATCC 51220 / DSM 2926 / LMG 16218 / CuHBu1) TaxID=572544 RepID=E3HA09_ILYPC|nr:thiamine ABC transporter substrate-binding protein [Ilyobacter polytropus]ADO83137.1 ABC transporter, periplasmic binding protein, thiB subfamily [Ilyobacter polytropus DSM 2926]